jgi:hypothetical protein
MAKRKASIRNPIISDDPKTIDLAFPQGLATVRGLVPRDYSRDPPEMFDPPSDMQIIDPSEWDARYEEQEAQQSSLEHLYLQGGDNPVFPCLLQGGDGYCWAYSIGHCIMFVRLASNAPLVRINPHATAAILMKGRNQGAWCGLSAKFGREYGYAVQGNGPGQWPLQSRSLKYDTPELRKAMLQNKILEDYADLTRDVYDQNLTTNQLATSLFNNIPCAIDQNSWGHSICAIRWVRIERGSYGPLILNSWPNWGRHGLAQLQGSKAIVDGAIAVRVTAA